MSSAKGYLWSVVSFLTAAIYGSIPTYLIVTFWQWINSITWEGRPLYTLTLFILFLWFVSLILTLIYLVAGVRAIVQRKSEDLGIPRGVKWFGAISSGVLITFMIVWYVLFNEIAFFSMVPP
ncbi:MAG: hypothetical protein EU548_06045 [Promethearchaeota archaeon]|nr:MAG: hypothetical protein EU548_06045 [Candidatus Lokiarchaeota archaeon]